MIVPHEPGLLRECRSAISDRMNADNSGPALASVLRDTLAPATLASLLHELATSAESRAEMCRQSYVHQNSFVTLLSKLARDRQSGC